MCTWWLNDEYLNMSQYKIHACSPEHKPIGIYYQYWDDWKIDVEDIVTWIFFDIAFAMVGVFARYKLVQWGNQSGFQVVHCIDFCWNNATIYSCGVNFVLESLLRWHLKFLPAVLIEPDFSVSAYPFVNRCPHTH